MVKIKFNRGDIASIYYPNQENSRQGTERYAVIIEDLGDEFIFVPITKQLHQKKNYPDSILIKKDTTTGKQMGLLYDSLLVVERATQLSKLRITLPKLGTCPEKLLNTIIFKLEELGLP
ncbi:MAG: type II toxin-antitoxin system PemK/MazF family toxin [Bacteroidia bacterium]